MAVIYGDLRKTKAHFRHIISSLSFQLNKIFRAVEFMPETCLRLALLPMVLFAYFLRGCPQSLVLELRDLYRKTLDQVMK